MHKSTVPHNQIGIRFSGKTIVPFCTHAGSGLGRCVTDISKLCPKSTLLDGVAFWGMDVKTRKTKYRSGCDKLKSRNKKID